MNTSKEHQKSRLSPIELYDEYGVPIPTQNRLRRERKIPYSKIGKMVRYKRTEIEEWFDNHKVN